MQEKVSLPLPTMKLEYITVQTNKNPNEGKMMMILSYRGLTDYSIICIVCHYKYTIREGAIDTISLRMNDEDTKLLRDYVSVNKLE